MDDYGLKIYDRHGEPMTLEEWSVKLGDADYKRVALTIIRKECRVSTVWLGLEHHMHFGPGPAPDYPVAIFETMIFGGPLDQEQWRYGTEEEAHAGHERAVRLAQMETYLEISEADEPAPAEKEDHA